MGPSKHLKTILCLATLVGVTVSTSPVGAEDSWKVSERIAQSFQAKSLFPEAAEAYQRAIAEVPPKEENERVRLLTVLSLVYSKFGHFAECLKAGQKVLTIVQDLQKKGTLDPDTLVFIEDMRKTCSPATNWTLNGHCPPAIQKQLDELSVLLRRTVAHNEKASASDVLRDAQNFIRLKNDLTAEEELSDTFAGLPPSARDYVRIKYALAALRAKHGKKGMMEQTLKEDLSHMPESAVLLEAANGEIFAWDFKASTATLDRLRKLLAQSKQKQLAYEIRMEQLSGDLHAYEADLKSEEIDRRRVLKLVMQAPNSSQAVSQAKVDLAICLAHQGRQKEANVLVPPHRSKSSLYEMILTDEDRAAMQKMGGTGGKPAH